MILFVLMLRTFPKGIFPSGNFQRVFSQVATSQMCNFLSGNIPSISQPQRTAPQPILAEVFGHLAHPSCSARPHCSLRRLKGLNLTLGKLPLGKLHIWEVATWEIVTWEATLWKMHLESDSHKSLNIQYHHIFS